MVFPGTGAFWCAGGAARAAVSRRVRSATAARSSGPPSTWNWTGIAASHSPAYIAGLLVFDENGTAQGWCQYGSPEELPGIKHRRAYEMDAPPSPDWRITCFFVDKKHRGQGIARAALEGALDQIAQLGGGLVEAISEVTAGRQAPGRFLFSATAELFEENGFARVRQVGKHAWIMGKTIQPA